MDVVTAFLLSLLDEEIYMEQLECFTKGKDLVCRLLKSLYSFKQAARVWNQKLNSFLIKIGFKQHESDHCVYINPEIQVIIAVWVDDLTILRRKLKNVELIKGYLAKEFEMKDLSELKNFLCMRVSRNRAAKTLTIDQEPYIHMILQRFDMGTCKPVSTHIASGTKLVRTGDDKPVDQQLYQSIVGSLMYAMLCIRPDIAYTVQ